MRYLIDTICSPGLAIRITGDVDEKINILKEADDIFIKSLIKHNLYIFWQAYCQFLLPIKTVGVMGTIEHMNIFVS